MQPTTLMLSMHAKTCTKPAGMMYLGMTCCWPAPAAKVTARLAARPTANPQHDASRSTAWAVVSAAEHHRPKGVVVENVPEFLDWELYQAWLTAMNALGYSLTPHIVDAADHGVLQNRVRMFLVGTRSKAALQLNLERREHVPATSFVDFNAGKWSQIDRPGRATATLERIKNGRHAHGGRFLTAYYGNAKGGRSVHRPIRTITTRDRWVIVDGDHMRMLAAQECRAAMGFPANYQLPKQHRPAVHMLGNAICPPVARDVISALIEKI